MQEGAYIWCQWEVILFRLYKHLYVFWSKLLHGRSMIFQEVQMLEMEKGVFVYTYSLPPVCLPLASVGMLLKLYSSVVHPVLLTFFPLLKLITLLLVEPRVTR